MNTPPLTRELRIKKLRYRCWHRGCKETDILLGKFGDQHVEDFTDDELDQFEVICDADDWDLYSWLTGKFPVPKEWNSPVMQRLMAFEASEVE